MIFFLPAAGYRNDTNLNNVGSNGNYWSSSLNTDNPNNAYNLNFNSGNVNRNNNNRYNGQSVRPVSELTNKSVPLPFGISSSSLLLDLYAAYLDARRHKRRKRYQLVFEHHLEEELINLRDEIIERRYVPGPASYGMTDTMGRMHSDAQFAGSSSVPAHVEMMGFLGMGNNPMVGATVAVAVSVAQALSK